MAPALKAPSPNHWDHQVSLCLFLSPLASLPHPYHPIFPVGPPLLLTSYDFMKRPLHVRLVLIKGFSSVQLLSCVQLFVTLCMDCGMLGFLVHHYLLEFAQTHVHWVREAIQPSCPLLSPSRLAFHLCSFRVFPNDLALCFHQNILQRVSSSHQGTKVLGIQLQHQSFQWIFRTDFL